MSDIKSKAKAKDNGDKIFDIARPGKSMPDATSKPIIVTNRPMLQDPMMVEDNPSQDTKDKDAESEVSSPKLTIKPITVTSDDEPASQSPTITSKPSNDSAADVNDKMDKADPTTNTDQTEKLSIDSPTDNPSTDQTVDPIETNTTDSPAAKEAAQVDKPLIKESDPPKPDESPDVMEAAAKLAEQEKVKHDAAIQKLADSKQYYLPIDSVEKRKTARFVFLGAGLIILLALVWLDIALDAGLIKLAGLHAVSHFFTK